MMQSPNRRSFLSACAATAVLSMTSRGKASASQTVLQQPQDKQRIAWHNPESWGVEGRGFDDTKSYYDRLPARAEGIVRDPVWNLSRHSAGISVRFKTDSPSIHVKYELTKKQLAMPHMPATGVSGVDLYAKDETGQWRWVAVVQPRSIKINTRIVKSLIPLPDNQAREFMLYWPLYNGVQQLEVGVAENAKFETVAPSEDKPILFYGTSIMHGACASRSGMSISAQIGRRLDRPTLNLGFSGNGRMEAEVGQFLAELDPCVFAIDCLPNMNAQAVSQRCVPLVKQLRAARPETPILLVADRVNTGAWIRNGAEGHHAKNREALLTAFDQLKSEGVKNIHYLGHDDLLGTDHDGATDGSHPNDLGMFRYADAYEKVLKEILEA